MPTSTPEYETAASRTPIEEPRTLLTVAEAAVSLAVPRSTLYLLLQRRALVSVKIGRLRRIPVWALEAFVRRLVAEQGGETVFMAAAEAADVASRQERKGKN